MRRMHNLGSQVNEEEQDSNWKIGQVNFLQVHLSQKLMYLSGGNQHISVKDSQEHNQDFVSLRTVQD